MALLLGEKCLIDGASDWKIHLIGKMPYCLSMVGPAHTRGRADKQWGTGSPKRINPINWGSYPTLKGLDLVVVIASPTSVRVPSHIWFISFWSDHMCTTPTHGTHMVAPEAYKPYVGGNSNRCGTCDYNYKV